MERLGLLEMAVRDAKEYIDGVAALTDAEYDDLQRSYDNEDIQVKALTTALLEEAWEESKNDRLETAEERM